jgi:hypothetical protein
MLNVKTDDVKKNFKVYKGEEPYLFISYSHRDTNTVYKILDRLDKEAFRFWYDDKMEVGKDFNEELKVMIEGCGAFVLFVSKESMQSEYVGMEIITAYKNSKRIYPIYLEEKVIPPVLKEVFKKLQHVKGYSVDKNEEYIDNLIECLPIETMHSLDVEDDVLKKCKDGREEINLRDKHDNIKIIASSAFKHCEKLEMITFSEKIEVIESEAFRGCKKIKRIVIPKSVKFIGDSAFRDCIALQELIVENGDIEIGERAFENCPELNSITLPEGLMEIYGGVFNSCKMLENIKLPEQLVILGESAFSSCVKLKKIIIPQNVTKIDDAVFNGCIELEEIILSDSLTKIGKYAFKDCMALTEIRIPENINSIGISPFRGCKNLESISVEPKNKYFKSDDGILFNKNKSMLVCHPARKSSEKYAIPDSVTVISEWAFCECTQLTEISIPDTTHEIGEGAFYKCVALERIELPDSVTKIDDIVFRGCTNLKEVIIPKSVKEFGWGLFNGCENVFVVCDDSSDAASYCEKRKIKHGPVSK